MLLIALAGEITLAGLYTLKYDYIQYMCRAFNIFQVYQYLTTYRQYFVLNWNKFHEYLIQHSLKSGGTKHHFRRVKVPGTTPY
jgi:hypothetical protein